MLQVGSRHRLQNAPVTLKRDVSGAFAFMVHGGCVCMDVFQHSLWVAAIFTSAPDVKYRSRRVVSGAEDFARLGPSGRIQSMARDLDNIYEGVTNFMASKGQKQSTPKSYPNTAWCNYKLSDADKEQFGSWEPDEDEIASALIQMVMGQYRFTASYDAYNKAVQVSVKCENPEDANYGKGFSTFAHSWRKVWALVVFKHYTIFQEQWPSAVAPSKPDDFG